MSKLKGELKLLYEQMEALQMRVHEMAAALGGQIPVERTPDLIDIGFMCREISNIADDIRKTASSRQAVTGRLIAMRAAAATMQGEEVVLRGEMATARPETDMKPKLPDPGSEDWNALMRWIGLTDEQIQRDMLRPSFSRLSEILKERAERGEQPPPGIVHTFSDAMVVFTRRKMKA